MLEKVKADDFSYIYELYMNPEVNPYLLYEMMDSETFRTIFNDLLEEEVLYLYKEGAETLGMCKLIRLKHRNEHILYLGGVAIHPDYFGKRFGKKMMLEIIEFCKKEDVLRIELSVAVHNEKAIQLYESVGFTKEGVLKNYTYLKSKNQFIDEVLMSNLL
jgi:ribosomal protein S18 acetylase RimI-like enzyme